MLVDEHEGLLLGVIYSIVRDRHAAEDLLQDTLLQAWRKLDSLKDAYRFRAWVSKIAINYALEWRRVHKWHITAMEILRERASRVRPPSALVKLDDLMDLIPDWEDRLIVSWFYVAGMRDREIAEELGWQPERVKKRRQRAEASLRRRLTQMEEA